MNAGDRIGAYVVDDEGGLVASYTLDQQKALGLSKRQKVGPQWVDAHFALQAGYDAADWESVDEMVESISETPTGAPAGFGRNRPRQTGVPGTDPVRYEAGNA